MLLKVTSVCISLCKQSEIISFLNVDLFAIQISRSFGDFVHRLDFFQCFRFFSHLLERGESYRETSSQATASNTSEDFIDDSLSKTFDDNDLVVGVDDFKKRLQYAMTRSLILQEKQMRDIESLEEALGLVDPVSVKSTVLASNESTAEIRKPLKGILKKSIRR